MSFVERTILPKSPDIVIVDKQRKRKSKCKYICMKEKGKTLPGTIKKMMKLSTDWGKMFAVYIIFQSASF